MGTNGRDLDLRQVSPRLQGHAFGAPGLSRLGTMLPAGGAGSLNGKQVQAGLPRSRRGRGSGTTRRWGRPVCRFLWAPADRARHCRSAVPPNTPPSGSHRDAARVTAPARAGLQELTAVLLARASVRRQRSSTCRKDGGRIEARCDRLTTPRHSGMGPNFISPRPIPSISSLAIMCSAAGSVSYWPSRARKPPGTVLTITVKPSRSVGKFSAAVGSVTQTMTALSPSWVRPWPAPTNSGDGEELRTAAVEDVVDGVRAAGAGWWCDRGEGCLFAAGGGLLEALAVGAGRNDVGRDQGLEESHRYLTCRG